MDHEFVRSIETWGSGGHMMDILVLRDGRILVIAEHGVTVYPDRAAFDSGRESAPIEVTLQPLMARMRR